MSDTFVFWNELELNSIMIDLSLKGWEISHVDYEDDTSAGVVYAKKREV